MLGQYILSVVAAAVIAGILTVLTDGKSGSAALLRLLAGLVLVFAVISPVAKLEIEDLTEIAAGYAESGTAAAQDGQEVARAAMAEIIKSETEAYILDKAESFRAELAVEVTLSQTGEMPAPVSVTLTGTVAPYAKSQLERMLEEDLGIAKENQQWIG